MMHALICVANFLILKIALLDCYLAVTSTNSIRPYHQNVAWRVVEQIRLHPLAFTAHDIFRGSFLYVRRERSRR